MKRLAAVTALVVVSTISTAAELPVGVQLFIDKRNICDHFRGEPWDPGDEPEIKERREFNFKNIRELCTGTDKRLTHLRHKYRNNQKVIDRLRDYEDKIELRKAAR